MCNLYGRHLQKSPAEFHIGVRHTQCKNSSLNNEFSKLKEKNAKKSILQACKLPHLIHICPKILKRQQNCIIRLGTIIKADCPHTYFALMQQEHMIIDSRYLTPSWLFTFSSVCKTKVTSECNYLWYNVFDQYLH